ncbi:MAG: hypothetical protein M8349_09145 [ANME-2 cluster archaeon]|nr:hypothetical protein [ANME-2 cluster archaeon]MDF1558535.1 hypothetical protein [ANME-2 cluster archaeon]
MAEKELVPVELEDGSIVECKKVKKFGYRIPKYKPGYLEALEGGEDIEMPVSCASTPTRFHNRENAIRYARKTKDGNVVFVSPTEVDKKKTEDWLAD